MIKSACLVVLMSLVLIAAEAPATQPGDANGAVDVAALQGKWKTGLIKSNGRDVTANNSYEFKVLNNTTVINVRGQELVSHFKLDPSKSPKEIDWTDPKGGAHLGVYAIDGETWKVHLAPVGHERVNDLSEDTFAFFRYERIKEK